jgi:ribonucleoside-diphosphate reductase beta chain
MTYSVFDSNNRKDATQVRAFFDDAPTIARYDKQKYAWIEKLTDKQLGFFWRPEEVDIYKDAKDFKDLTVHEQHIFTSNLKRQILLDSVQGRAPTMAFGPICSLPELETWITTWAFSETIHSRSYTHIIRNIYPNPSKIFDEIMDIPEIVECAGDISKYYDYLIAYNNAYADSYNTFMGSDMTQNTIIYDMRHKEHKKALWLALMSVNVLEGVRFYVSFACSWAFAEVKKMEGNAKIIKFIARDENLHLAGTQQLLKALPKEDPEFARIAEETRNECINLFNSAVEQEKAWASYLFRDGSMVGLNETLLSEYIEWIANKRMTAIGLPTTYKGGSNPLPWTQKWISGSEVQVAPQETEITSYVNGGVKKDVNGDTFKGFSL